MGQNCNRTAVYSKKGHTIKSIYAGRRHHINFFKFDKIICASKNPANPIKWTSLNFGMSQ